MAKRGRPNSTPLIDCVLMTAGRAKKRKSIPVTEIEKPMTIDSSQAIFLFPGFRATIDGESGNHVEPLVDETTTARKFDKNMDTDEETTPPLWRKSTESDNEDDDANTLDYLNEYIGSLTNDETDEILQGFESYIQLNHKDDYDVTRASNHPCDNTVDGTKTPDPASFSSLTKWLQCRCTSASVEGIHFKNSFEPTVHTLDGIRKELFAE